MLNTFFLPILSKCMNAYLHLDPNSVSRLQYLDGHIITIELLPFHFIFQCVFTADGVHLFQHENKIADTKIIGTPLRLMQVMINKKHRQQFFSDDVKIEGNAEIGQQVIALFDELEIDDEALFAQFIGDVPAYHTKRFLQRTKKWLKKTDDSLTQQIRDYLHEEKTLYPSREALQDFYQDIDLLRMDVDRMEAKIKHILFLLET